MRKTSTFHILYFIVVLGVCTSSPTSTASPECKFWHGIADNLSDAQSPGFLKLSCNSTCSSITCNGHADAAKLPLAPMAVDMDFCFGLRLNHCDLPVDMDYYLSIPSQNVMNNGTIAHNDSFEFPAISGDRHVMMVVVIEMVRVNSSYVLFGITGKVKVTLAGIEEFPYSETVFPPTLIDVPPCQQRGLPKPPFNAPDKCVGPRVTSSVTVKSTSTLKPVIKSKTFNTTCEYGLVQCGAHEMCKSMNDKAKNGICVCDSSSHFDGNSGYCVPTETPQPPAQNTIKSTITTHFEEITTTQSLEKSTTHSMGTNGPSVTGEHKHTKPGATSTAKPPMTTATPKPNSPSVTEGHKNAKAGTNMTPVIIGAVFGGLLLIVVVVSVIIFIGRRRRQAILRGQHQLLMDNDDDDDDRNLVI